LGADVWVSQSKTNCFFIKNWVKGNRQVLEYLAFSHG
jgi:hypothetical protein